MVHTPFTHRITFALVLSTSTVYAASAAQQSLPSAQQQTKANALQPPNPLWHRLPRRRTRANWRK
ncbi:MULTISPECIES: hypothetical protein [Acetobacter]|jgi:hypothetical protein|uniref:Uncharacterized protein n=1 Tax=Acetobacter lovaniensis TaxID=104100 RepID=A0A841QIB7_9PROT|nr:hypothetical protein [Acetobacter lovaniensis]MBB6457747.1 hypothetical protein [Acetobacter lovaniensis]MCI1698607.1 hypothetical protein [Acetobacter lovaniensis]MCI1796456.1 hypothetical protein [Acetobacter lovaniensis]MCP1239913.1 hypothetical protein [Acetobacter lovaniensis]NHN82013.1 hypothetical protein [Acetobacter lovaniensis]